MNLHYHSLIIVFVMAIMIPAAYATYTVDPVLITTVQNYIDTSKTQVSQEKWTRALAGLGGVSHDNPMTAQEAQINAYKFDPNRWNPVIEAMISLQGVTVDKPAALISAVQDYAAESHVGSQHVDRWNRVLAALGSGTHDNPMTAAEAQTYADRGWKRWIPVVDTLTILELQPQAAPQTEQAGQPPQWEQPQSPQDSPQNAEQAPTREERLAEGKQILQEAKSIVAELRQDLAEATAFVNTLDNKAPYTEILETVERVIVRQEDRVIPSMENFVSTSIRVNSNYEGSFQILVSMYKGLRDGTAPDLNDRLAPILFVKEATIQMQELREIRSQAHAMMAEAKEFVKKWDETPTSYAKAIEQAELAFRFVNTIYLEPTYEQLLNKPTSVTFQQTMQGYYRSIPSNFEVMENHLETLLSTARQPSAQEQCDQPGVTCDWYSAPNDMQKTYYEYTDSYGSKIRIEYFVSGEISYYIQYHPHDPSQKEFQIKYRDPYNTAGCSGQDWCRGQPHEELGWYSNGQKARETQYRPPDDGTSDRKTIDKAWREDGSFVFNIFNIHPTTQVPGPGSLYAYPDGSRKATYGNNGALTCYEDGTGSTQGDPEPCRPFHTRPQY